jgi:hypothetical protein
LRTLRKVIDVGLPLIGVAITLNTVLFLRGDVRVQVAVVGLGIVVIELGVWKLAHRLLPSGRKYLALRAETDAFFDLVRRLNTAAVALKQDDSPEHRQAFAESRQTMHAAVERMAAVAGQTSLQPAAEREVTA